jgi:hypothetical protein
VPAKSSSPDSSIVAAAAVLSGASICKLLKGVENHGNVSAVTFPGRIIYISYFIQTSQNNWIDRGQVSVQSCRDRLFL